MTLANVEEKTVCEPNKACKSALLLKNEFYTIPDMGNFDFLKKYTQFSSFANDAIAAEELLSMHPADCLKQCRLALELASRWICKQENLNLLKKDNQQMSLDEIFKLKRFANIIKQQANLFELVRQIKQDGNEASHRQREKFDNEVGREMALYNLIFLFYFMDFIAQKYADDFSIRIFDKNLINDINSFESTEYSNFYQQLFGPNSVYSVVQGISKRENLKFELLYKIWTIYDATVRNKEINTEQIEDLTKLLFYGFSYRDLRGYISPTYSLDPFLPLKGFNHAITLMEEICDKTKKTKLGSQTLDKIWKKINNIKQDGY